MSYQGNAVIVADVYVPYYYLHSRVVTANRWINLRVIYAVKRNLL